MPFFWKFGPRRITESIPGLGDLGEPFPGTETSPGFYEMDFAFEEDPEGFAVLGIESIPDPPKRKSQWSIDLCRSGKRIGHLQFDAFAFNGLKRRNTVGEWTLDFADAEPSWSLFKHPNLSNFLRLTGVSGCRAATPDAAALDITGDIDVRWFGTLTDWAAGSQSLINKWLGGGQQSWVMQVESGAVRVYISTDGSNFPFTGTFPVSFVNGQYGGIRFTRVQTTGVVEVFFSLDGVGWQSAGTSTVSAGSAMFNSTAALAVGDRSDGTFPATGRCLWAEVRNGVDGTVIASPNFRQFDAGRDVPFGDVQGNTWSMFDGAQIIADPLAVEKSFTPLDVDLVRVVEDGKVRYGGRIHEPSSGRGGQERVVTASGIRWTLSGPDMWDVLRSRVAFPDPTKPDPATWSVSHDTRTGVASTVLTDYLTNNAGVNAIDERKIAGFVVTDRVTGMSGTWTARLQPLDELAQRICEDADLICRVEPELNGDTVATIETPRDLSTKYVLSDQGDLINIRSRSIPARSTWVLAGGQGEGTLRTFRDADSGAQHGDRRETFTNQSSLADTSELQASADANLRLDGETWSVSAEANDSAADAIMFGRDVLVGDKVAIDVQGTRHVVPVTALAFHITAERQVVRPTLGEASPDALKGLQRDVADLQSRFATDIA